MAHLGQSFDANTISPDSAFEPLPAGDYLCMITDSAMKPTKNGAGHYLELAMQVIEGRYANRLLWDRLTLIHPNAKTVEIAQQRLSAICHAVGVLQITDSAQLHNLPLVVRIKYLDDPQFGAKNEVVAYKPQHPPATAPAAHPKPQAAAAPPWSHQGAPAQPKPQAAAAPPWEQR
jgi:hypothetical protein